MALIYGDLTTFDAVFRWLRVTGIPATDFEMLQDLITSASDFIHTWTNRFFPIADYEDIRDGTGTRNMVFANPPVLSVASINVDGVEIPPSPNTTAFGYVFTPTRISLRGYHFRQRPLNTVIVYTAGYAQIPPMVSQACIELVGQQYRERARIGVKQEATVGVDSATYNVDDLQPHTLTALAQIRNVVPISGSRRLAQTQTDPTLIAAVL
jgi:hypothetical protein